MHLRVVGTEPYMILAHRFLTKEIFCLYPLGSKIFYVKIIPTATYHYSLDPIAKYFTHLVLFCMRYLPSIIIIIIIIIITLLYTEFKK